MGEIQMLELTIIQPLFNHYFNHYSTIILAIILTIIQPLF